MTDRDAKLKALLERLQKRDRDLHEEIYSQPGVAGRNPEGPVTESVGADSRSYETIVLTTGRPVLPIFHGEPQLTFRESKSEIWRDRLKGAFTPLVKAIEAVGRIELTNHEELEWGGTGWLVKEDVIVTNRHVARLFARRDGEGFVFKKSAIGRMSAQIDFLEEIDNRDSNEMKVIEVLYIEEEGDNNPDVAFLRVQPPEGRKTAQPIVLSTDAPEEGQQVAVIGYPARDSRIPDQKLMEEIFGEVYDKKRLAPGQLLVPANGLIEHDCTTLGGNSGSVVLSLTSGWAAGLHFSGSYLKANFAVPAAVVADRLNRIGRSSTTSSRTGTTTSVTPPPPRQENNPPMPNTTHSLTCIIPIRVQIEIGAPQIDPQGPAAVAQVVAVSAASIPSGLDAIEAGITTEAPVASYDDREGYDSDFLGSNRKVPLPVIGKEKDEIVTFGGGKSELKYRNFSVVMHHTRRQCFFSAVIIDGKLSKRTVRTGWKFDPRLPSDRQIKGECYGDAPKYSRGHMTRREDPAWGTSQKLADLGCSDSMHVTNTVPQMQTFNGGVWLSLEDYALQNAREDDQRISVFTGPFFTEDDPEQYGILIPRAFWKIIVFLHDKTQKLTATGYSISQQSHIPETEFVFGKFGTYQRSIKWIEQRAGLSFGDLSEHDPKNKSEESLASDRPLPGVEGIRFE